MVFAQANPGNISVGSSLKYTVDVILFVVFEFSWRSWIGCTKLRTP
jgi:hypothetical protein